MKSSSQVTGLPLMGIKEGLEFGTVRDIVVDPQEKKVKSLILQGTTGGYDFRELGIADVVGIGKDYVITESIENAAATRPTEAGMMLLGIRCISSSGNVLGIIKDFVFNEKTGEIQTIQLDNGAELSGSSMRALSNNLLFVNVEGVEAPEAAAASGFVSLEKEQQDYMIGRVVKSDIFGQDGQVIIQKGTKVTADVIRIAEEAGVMIDLTLEL